MDSSACEAVYSTNFISRERDFLLMLKINYEDKNDQVREFYEWNGSFVF